MCVFAELIVKLVLFHLHPKKLAYDHRMQIKRDQFSSDHFTTRRFYFAFAFSMQHITTINFFIHIHILRDRELDLFFAIVAKIYISISTPKLPRPTARIHSLICWNPVGFVLALCFLAVYSSFLFVDRSIFRQTYIIHIPPNTHTQMYILIL